jgi:type II secretory pathway component PulL
VSQRILSIDASAQPPQAVLLEVDGANFQILEQHTLNLDLDSANLNSGNLNSGNLNLDSADPARADRNGDQSHLEDSPQRYKIDEQINPFHQLTKELSQDWDLAGVVFAPKDLIALSLTLPFSSRSDLAQIIEGEVQDLIPFSIEDFHLHYDIRGETPQDQDTQGRAQGTTASEETEVRVQLIRKEVINELLQLCKNANIEPSIVTTPGALLPMLIPYEPGLTDQPHAIIRTTSQHITMSIFAGGGYRSEHIFPNLPDLSSVTKELKRCLYWAEHRYQAKIANIFFLGDPQHKRLFEQSLETRFTDITPPPHTSENSLLCTMAALAIQDAAPYVPKGNLRSGAYGYNAHLRRVLLRAKQLAPAAGLLFLSLLVSLSLVYVFRAYQIKKYDEAIQAKIRSVVPDLQVPKGAEAAGLRGRIRQLEEQLKALNGISTTSPLEPLGLLAKYLPQKDGIELDSLSIKGNWIKLKGQAPDHAAVEGIKKELKRKRRIFCRIKKVRANKSGDRIISFEYAIEMCEE